MLGKVLVMRSTTKKTSGPTGFYVFSNVWYGSFSNDFECINVPLQQTAKV